MKNTWTNIKHEQNMSVRMCVCTCVYACVCVHASLCACMCVCVCKCMCACVRSVCAYMCWRQNRHTQKLIFLPSTFLSKRERKITGEKSHTDLCPFKLSQKVTRPSVLMVITHACTAPFTLVPKHT